MLQNKEPQVWLVEPTPKALYTLIKTGPDVPSRTDPQLREYIHHLIINIPSVRSSMPSGDHSCLLSGRGETILPYVGSRDRVPGAGLCRHVWMVFRHWSPLNADKARKYFGGTEFEHRAEKRAKAFAQENKLGNPVSILCYQSEVKRSMRSQRNSTLTLLAALDSGTPKGTRDSFTAKSNQEDDAACNKLLGECTAAEREAMRTRTMLRRLEIAVAKGVMSTEDFEKIKANAIKKIKRKKVWE